MKKAITLLLSTVVMTGYAWAQPLPPPPPNTAIPLDIIAGVLVVGGLVYGVIGLVRSRKANQASA